MWGPMITAMVTPFDAQGAVDHAAVRPLVRRLLDTGSSALLVNGTTGESPTLSHDDKLALLDTVQQAAEREVPVLMGTGSNDTATTVAFTREVCARGIDGILLVTPYYNKPTQEGLRQHFAQAAAAAGDVPVMLYNIESRTARNIAPATIGQLAREVPNIVAVKEASGDIGQFADVALAVAAADGFHLYSGNDSDTLALLCVGAVGVVSVASHVAGRTIREMIEAFQAGRVDQARTLNLRLHPLIKALFPPDAVNPAPVKEALNQMGLSVGGLRLPLVPAGERVSDELEQVLQQLGAL